MAKQAHKTGNERDWIGKEKRKEESKRWTGDIWSQTTLRNHGSIELGVPSQLASKGALLV